MVADAVVLLQCVCHLVADPVGGGPKPWVRKYDKQLCVNQHSVLAGNVREEEVDVPRLVDEALLAPDLLGAALYAAMPFAWILVV